MRRITALTIVTSLAACTSTHNDTADERVASVAEPLSCSAEEIESGQRVCAGSFSYSLVCYGLERSAACGVDEGAAACTTYATCAHPDFGTTRGTYTETVVVRPADLDMSESLCADFYGTRARPPAATRSSMCGCRRT